MVYRLEVLQEGRLAVNNSVLMFAHAETLMPFLVSLGLYQDQEPVKVNHNIETVNYEFTDLEPFFSQLLSIVSKVRIKNGSNLI